VDAIPITTLDISPIAPDLRPFCPARFDCEVDIVVSFLSRTREARLTRHYSENTERRPRKDAERVL
jgi:hypothetical protein